MYLNNGGNRTVQKFSAISKLNSLNLMIHKKKEENNEVKIHE